MPKKQDKKEETSDFDCIVALTEAEKKAKNIIEQARKRRAHLLKKTKDDVAAEVEAYRKACEEHMVRLQRDYSSGQDLTVNKFSKETSEKNFELKKLYENTYRNVLISVLEKVLKPEARFHENLKL